MANYEAKHAERYWEILQNNIDWLRFSETKATLILTVYGILFTIAYTNAGAVFNSIKGSDLILCLIFIYGILCLTSIGYAFFCVNPALKNPNPNSIIYYGHIAEKYATYGAYKTYAQSIIDNEDKFTDQITEQIHVISNIAWKKYRYVGWSIRFFILSLVVLIITIFIYLMQII
jgi:hypothetical protein